MQQRANINFSINSRRCEEMPGRKWFWIFHPEVIHTNRQSRKQAHPNAANFYLLSGLVLQVGDQLRTISVRVGKDEGGRCAGKHNGAHHQNKGDAATNSHHTPDRNKCVLPSLMHETSERSCASLDFGLCSLLLTRARWLVDELSSWPETGFGYMLPSRISPMGDGPEEDSGQLPGQPLVRVAGEQPMSRRPKRMR